MLNEHKYFISWKTEEQFTIAHSACEAEYRAITYSMPEGIYLRQLLLQDLQQKYLIINLYVDNKGAVDLVKHSVHHQ